MRDVHAPARFTCSAYLGNDLQAVVVSPLRQESFPNRR